MRKWLRTGVIKGIPPKSRKEGWRITEEDLQAFIKKRLPEEILFSNKTYVTNEKLKETLIEQQARELMWWELVRQNIFEGFIDIKKTRMYECVEHADHSKKFAHEVWDEVKEHKRGASKPRIPYLLDAFLYDGERVLMEKTMKYAKKKFFLR
ncbi:hypothetical protein CAI16_20015 [Virgibacillus dokdonensis]|uniref:Uncharacterized protein n=1 Tax=Virgibacillus dokdonensis TaxID=302167 RepID=A0A3E0WHP9_9BACI|nr:MULTISPECIES: hypothetical protein [Virgibacillus]RFA31753.1 hypothetical protein CAI16_20015 [Virgibacillus dokdonensis]